MELTPVHPLITVQADGMWVALVGTRDLHLAASEGAAVIREMLTAEHATGGVRRFTSWQNRPGEMTMGLLSEERSKLFNSVIPYQRDCPSRSGYFTRA